MQDAGALQLADTRLAAVADRRLARILIPVGAAITALLAAAMGLTALYLTGEDGRPAMNTDFRVFWAAGRLAWEGTPRDVLDISRLESVHGVTSNWMPWLYPPGFIALVTPLGAMPSAYGFAAWTALSVAMVALATRPFVGSSRKTWLAASLAPAYAPALFVGQTSVLWLAVLLLSLAAMRDGKHILAGVLIGLLTLKPQLGLLIPVALLAAGLRTVILSATATTLVLTGLATAIVGWDYWPRLVETMAQQADRVISNIASLDLMVGVFSLIASLGVPASLALGMQWGVTALVAAAVFFIWRSSAICFDTKAAVLIAAALISTPYLWFYETAMLAAIGLFMVRGGQLASGLLQMMLLFLLWTGPIFLQFNNFQGQLNNHFFGAYLITPVLVTSLFLLVRHALLQTGPAAPST